jgi:hypothetical protein
VKRRRASRAKQRRRVGRGRTPNGRRIGEGPGGVRAPSPVVACQPMRRRGGHGTGDESPPDPTKGPCRWKASRIITSRRLSRAGGHGGLGGSLTVRERERRLGSPRPQEGEATGMSEARSFEGAAGRQRPRSALRQAKPVGPEANQHTSGVPKRVSSTVRRSVPGVVKTPGSPVKSRGAQTPRGVHAAKAAAA